MFVIEYPSYIQPLSSATLTKNHMKGIGDTERWEGGLFRGGKGVESEE